MSIAPNELDEVAARAKRRFPDHKVDIPFHVCLPVYELRLKATEITEDDLSTPARFILQLSNLNVTQPAEISRLLGLPPNYVASAAAELLGENLVAQSPLLSIGITDAGRKVLRDGGKTLRPRNTHFRIPYDPLTKRIFDIDVEELSDRDDVRKNGLFVLPTKPRRPHLNNIRIDEVKDYVLFYGRRRDKTEILEVSDIKEVRLKYRKDIILVKLDAANTNKPLFAAYRAQQYLEEESALMQRLADRGADLVPEELKAELGTLPIQSQSLSEEESTLIEEIDGLDRDVGEAERAVAEAKVAQGTTQSAQERAAFESRIETLESEKLQLESLLAERESTLTSVTEGQIRLIRTEEHHHLLLKAIGKATSQLTLVSAWIDPYAFDDEVCRMLAAAIGRGVEVRIAWGLAFANAGPKPPATERRVTP